MDWDVVVIGAGAAGLVAAERAAHRGRRTLLLEKNRRPGVKILMSGGTRCNLTHATDSRGMVTAYGPSGRFLHSALAQLSPRELVALVENEGVATKVEETGKIFPVSNRATDILAAFLNRLARTACTLATAEPVTNIERVDGGFRLKTSQRQVTTENLIITTGGKSYPRSGTAGDGYGWAEQFGHTIVRLRPALVPITTNAAWVRELMGVTISDVVLSLHEPSSGDGKQKLLDQRRGSLLFTHFGLSGPVALDISRSVTSHPRPNTLSLVCDFLPEVNELLLDEQLRRGSAAAGKKHLPAMLPTVIVGRLAEALITQAGLTIQTRAAELSKAGRAALVAAIKRTAIPASGTRGFEKAEVTAGGVTLAEIDSRTMQSKLVPGLYWAGEVIDLDGPIGGYNFQAAFSTGWLAGNSV